VRARRLAELSLFAPSLFWLQEHKIEPIDLVVCNLYAFEKAVAGGKVSGMLATHIRCGRTLAFSLVVPFLFDKTLSPLTSV
jgi:hypothetical protein